MLPPPESDSIQQTGGRPQWLVPAVVIAVLLVAIAWIAMR
jgi:hypothetical protein